MFPTPPPQDITILFMDIVGFTSMSKEVEPALVMTFLNQ
jgi:class 3 adenylate cyclase